ncbi:MAG: helix-turn-helix domain-containing protein [Legionellales bacterium]|nr:helix-turn-helix domain-containing protein [Legionellales bacterium]
MSACSIPRIVSIVHQNEIEMICKGLPKEGGLKYFVCYVIFNNAQTFVLSNMFHMLIPYYTEQYYKQDFSFRREITSDVNYYLCDRVKNVSAEFSDILESKFKINRAFYIVRNSPECQFVFGCIPKEKPSNFDDFYQMTLEKFENFCVEFVDRTVDIIKLHNPSYNQAIILNDKTYRKSIIKTKGSNRPQLTRVEMDVLNWTAYGKSAQEIAQIMSEKVTNINFFRNQLKKKLNTYNMPHAVFEGIRQGYIGAFNSAWRGIDYVLSNLSVTNEDDQEYREKISSLLLLNEKSR